MRKKSLLVLLFLLSHALGQLSLDPLLLEHCIYGVMSIKNNNNCTYPKSGKVGTPGLLNNDGNLLTIQTNTRAGTVRGNNTKIAAGDTLFYTNQGTPCGLDSSTGGKSIIVDNVYPILPKFPDLSSISFSGGANITAPGTYYPAHYNSLNPDWTVSTNLFLTAGVYYFNEISIGASKKVTIIPNAQGSYQTTIYVNSKVSFGDNSALDVSTDAGKGKVLIAYKGLETFEMVSNSKVVATIIAPYADINFTQSSKLVGQAMSGKNINLIGFDGGEGLTFEPYFTSPVTFGGKDFNEDRNQTPTKADSLASHPYDTTVSVSINAVPAGKTATLYYHIEDITDAMTAGVPTAHPTHYNVGGTTVFTGGSLLYAAGETKKDLQFRIEDGSDYNSPDRRFKIVIDNAVTTGGNYSITGLPVEQIVTIKNDDPKNSAPTGITLTPASVKENQNSGVLVGTLTTTDPDAGNTFTYTLINDASGAFTLSGDKIYTGRKLDYETEQSLTIQVRSKDTYSDSVTKDITIQILPVNDSTNSSSDANYTVAETGTLTDAALPVPADKDIPALENRFRYKLVTGPVNALNFTFNSNGTFTYSPKNAGVEYAVNPADSFSYQVIDSASYDGTPLTGNISKARITITDVDDNNPTARDTLVSIFENQSIEIDLSSLIGDLDKTPVTISPVVKQPVLGTAVPTTGNKIRYTHTSSRENLFTDSFTYAASSNGKTGAEATVTVTIKPINDNPAKANSSSYQVSEYVTVSTDTTVNAITDAAADTDADGPAGFNAFKIRTTGYIQKNPSIGTIKSIKEDGTIVYSPIPGKTGKDTVIVVLADSANAPYWYSGSDAAQNKVNVTTAPNLDTLFFEILRKNVAPVIAKDTGITVFEGDTKQSITLPVGSGKLISDINKDDKLTLSIISPSSTAGTVYVQDGSDNSNGGSFVLEYTPSTDPKTEKFSDVINYRITDAAGASSDGKISVTISPMNDNAAVTSVRDTTCTRGGIVAGLDLKKSKTDDDRFPENIESNVFKYKLVSVDKNRFKTLTISEDGMVTLEHDGNPIGTDNLITITYELVDSINYLAQTKAPYSHKTTGTLRVSVTPDFSLNPTTLEDMAALTVKEVKDAVSSSIPLAALVKDGDLPDGDAIDLSIADLDTVGTARFTGNLKTVTVNKTNIGSLNLIYTYNRTKEVEVFSGSFSITATNKPTPTSNPKVSKTYSVNITKLNGSARFCCSERSFWNRDNNYSASCSGQ